jgi:hypothetical protein
MGDPMTQGNSTKGSRIQATARPIRSGTSSSVFGGNTGTILGMAADVVGRAPACGAPGEDPCAMNQNARSTSRFKAPKGATAKRILPGQLYGSVIAADGFSERVSK